MTDVTDPIETDYEVGQDNVRVWGLDIHNPVFLISAIIIIAFVIGTLIAGEAAGTFFDGLRKDITTKFDWFFLLAGNIFVVVCLVLMLSPLGKVRIGGQEATPEHSRASWFAMLFAAGMGIGLMFWAVAEPTVYGAGVWGYAPLGEEKSKEMAFAATIFHWGLHPWAIYAIVALALAFFCYSKDLPLTIRSAFFPILGDRVWGWPGHVIDIFAVFATMFGLATSLGLGAQQAASGLNIVFEIDPGTVTQVVLIIGITAVALVSVMAGLEGGVKRLSNFNIIVALIFMAAVFALGPTTDILTGIVANTGYYLKDLIPLSNPFGREDSGFVQDWTSFYWAWWIAWSPFVGMFIARVSKGRTVREFVFCVLIVPTVVSIVWMTVFGESALSVVAEEAGSLANAVGEGGVYASALAEQVANDYSKAMFTMFGHFPASTLLSIIAIILVITFFVTSSDSGSLVIDSITAGGKIDAPVAQRVLWCLLEGGVAIALLIGGGLGALQAAAIATGLPFAVILLVMSFCLVKALLGELKLLKHGVGS